MRRVLLIGYFGYGNLGDEALLEVAVRELQRIGEESDAPERITVVSADPAATQAALGVRAVPRSPLLGVLLAIGQADAVVIGPGGIFQDATSVRSTVYYAGLAKWARMQGKPVYLVGHGLGPLGSTISRWATRSAIRGSSGLSVRDEASAALARDLAPKARIIEAADPALLLEPDTQAAREHCQGAASAAESGERVCAVSLRPWGAASLDHEMLAAILDAVRAELGCRLLLVPLGGESDRRLLLDVRRLLSESAWLYEGPLVPRIVLGVLCLCDFVLSMRLHGLILGAMGGARLAGIVYDPKVSAFLAQVGVAPALTVDDAPWCAASATRAIVRSFAAQDPEETAAKVVQLKVRAALSVRLLREACEPAGGE